MPAANPMVVLFAKHAGAHESSFDEVGRTEKLKYVETLSLSLQQLSVVLSPRASYEGSFLTPLVLRRKIGQDNDVKFVIYDVQSATGAGFCSSLDFACPNHRLIAQATPFSATKSVLAASRFKGNPFAVCAL
jgi:hypothetical protein